MKRDIDKFDIEASREGRALGQMAHWLKNPERASKGGMLNPRRLFTNIRCFGVETMNPYKYKKLMRTSFHNQYRPVRDENKQPVETKCE